MYRFNSNNAFLLFPTKEKSHSEKYRIKETNGFIKKIGLAIPQASASFKDFIGTMNIYEQELKKDLLLDG